MTGDGGETPTSVTRRGYLTAITASTALAFGATTASSAAESGYGTTGYGTDPYGGADSTSIQLGVTTDGAGDIGTASAALTGTVTQLDGTDSVTVYFEWGPSTDGLTTATAQQTLTSTGSFEESISGLDTDTAYDFRAVATVDSEVATGSTLTFQTDAEGVPTIDTLTGQDVSNPKNPHVDAEIYWQASIDESELYAADLTLTGPNGVIETWDYDLGGQSAEHTETTRIPHGAKGAGTEYTVDLIVYSYYGNYAEATTTFESQ